MADVDDKAELFVQVNVPGEDDQAGTATYTVATGDVFGVFLRLGGSPGGGDGDHFVIDARVTNCEGGILECAK